MLVRRLLPELRRVVKRIAKRRLFPVTCRLLSLALLLLSHLLLLQSQQLLLFVKVQHECGLLDLIHEIEVMQLEHFI